jgi:hypothetical protein
MAKSLRVGRRAAKKLEAFANTMTTPAAVNKVLRQRGHAERLVRGRGYYYFIDGDAFSWFSQSIPCMWLVGTPEKFADMRDDLATDPRNIN